MLLLIANDGPLGPEWLDHPLGGDWDGHRECHIGGDFLLIYKLDDDEIHGRTARVRDPGADPMLVDAVRAEIIS